MMNLVLRNQGAVPIDCFRCFAPRLQGVKLLAPCSSRKGGGKMGVVTYEGLFQFCLLLITFAGLIVSIKNKK